MFRADRCIFPFFDLVVQVALKFVEGGHFGTQSHKLVSSSEVECREIITSQRRFNLLAENRPLQT